MKYTFPLKNKSTIVSRKVTRKTNGNNTAENIWPKIKKLLKKSNHTEHSNDCYKYPSTTF